MTPVPAFSVIIPTLNAGTLLGPFVDCLRRQTMAPSEIIVIDSSSEDDTLCRARQCGCEVLRIDRTEFNHGGTRNLGALHAHSEILVFMTQDAMPRRADFFEELLEPILSGVAVAVYARQVAHPTAGYAERFARTYNYPAQDCRTTWEDVGSKGVRAFFFSNVASAFRKDAFMAAGMFPDDIIMNEDMLMCARLLREGFAVYYASRAVVLHSHDYSCAQLFRRYFDIGVFFARDFHEDGLQMSRHGMAYTRVLLTTVVRDRRWSDFMSILLETGVKFVAYHCGRRARLLPLRLKLLLSMHASYWHSSAARSKVVSDEN